MLRILNWALTRENHRFRPPFSVGRCVIPCAFLVKVSNIHFLVEKCILFKKKDVYNFFWRFNVTVTSQSDVTIFSLFKA